MRSRAPVTAWRALLFLAAAALLPVQGADIVLEADVRGPGKQFAGAVRLLEGGDCTAAGRAGWLEALKIEVAECGTEEVRLSCRGAAAANFVIIDDVLDRLVAMGVRPALVRDDRIPSAVLRQHVEDRFTGEERRRWPAIGVAPAQPDPAAADYCRDVLPAAVYLLARRLEGQAVAGLAVCDDPVASEADGQGVFHGGAGLLTFQGVVKPVFHACRLLRALGDEVLTQAPGGIVTRRRNSGRLVALVYNLPGEAPLTAPSLASLGAAERLAALGTGRNLVLSLTGLRPGGQVLVERVDLVHGNAVGAWRALGAPRQPGRGALEALREQARAGAVEFHQADDLGRFEDRRVLGPWSMLLFREL